MISSGYRLLIVCQPTIIREILWNYFQNDPDCASAQTVTDISSAIEYLHSEPVDVILVDSDDLVHDLGFTFCDRLWEDHFAGAVVVLATRMSEFAIRLLLARGATAVILKSSTLKHLASCIREAAQSAHSEPAQYSCSPAPQRLRQQTVAFTDRQAQVLRGVAEGQANKEIAAALGVSETSVKCTVQQIFAKTGVRSRSALVRLLLGYHAEEVLDEVTASIVR
jgi:two-component system, NarL family, nitrate/nitrite response regulator NarL